MSGLVSDSPVKPPLADGFLPCLCMRPYDPDCSLTRGLDVKLWVLSNRNYEPASTVGQGNRFPSPAKDNL
jgi:hypothetical protein